jgi:sugar diacid utilization regulator
MTKAVSDQLIRRWSEQFLNDSLAAKIVAGLRDRSDAIWQHAFHLLQRESSEYRNAVDAEFARESRAHCNTLLQTIVAIAERGGKNSGSDRFEFVRTHAAWRARHRVPLIASLHAYRLAHRTYWEITRDALPKDTNEKQAIHSLTMLSDFWMELFDHVGAVLAEAHAVEERRIVAQSTQAHESLVTDLLHGREPRAADAQQLCALCGIRPGAAMAVLVARTNRAGDGEQTAAEAALRSFARHIEQVLPRATYGTLIDIRNGEAVVIACSEADAGRGLKTILRRNGFVRSAAGAQPMTVGIGLDATEISRLPLALEEAYIAIEFTGAARPLMHFADIDLPEFLVRRADGAAMRLIPEWARRLSQSKDDQSRELCRTIQAFADSNFNVKQTARRLNIHTNTVYFRLNRITSLTGINPRTYSGTSRMLTALRLLEIQNGRGHGQPQE